MHSYEQRAVTLPEPYATSLRKNKRASRFFESSPASYRKAVNWWVVSAKLETTRERRVAQLILDSAAGRWIRQFTRYVAPEFAKPTKKRPRN
jgi:uncharacterized protein YdeI (YjbR/CyaY-like superfamily)